MPTGGQTSEDRLPLTGVRFKAAGWGAPHTWSYRAPPSLPYMGLSQGKSTHKAVLRERALLSSTVGIR